MSHNIIGCWIIGWYKCMRQFLIMLDFLIYYYSSTASFFNSIVASNKFSQLTVLKVINRFALICRRYQSDIGVGYFSLFKKHLLGAKRIYCPVQRSHIFRGPLPYSAEYGGRSMSFRGRSLIIYRERTRRFGALCRWFWLQVIDRLAYVHIQAQEINFVCTLPCELG